MTSRTAKMILLGTVTARAAAQSEGESISHDITIADLTLPEGMTIQEKDLPKTQGGRRVKLSSALRKKLALTESSHAAAAASPVVEALPGNLVRYAVNIKTTLALPRDYPVVRRAGALLDALQGGQEEGGEAARLVEGPGLTTVTAPVPHAEWLAADLRKDVAAALHVCPSLIVITGLKVVMTANSKIPRRAIDRKGAEEDADQEDFLQPRTVLGEMMKFTTNHRVSPRAVSWMDLGIDFKVVMSNDVTDDTATSQPIAVIQNGAYKQSKADLSKVMLTVIKAFEDETGLPGGPNNTFLFPHFSFLRFNFVFVLGMVALWTVWRMTEAGEEEEEDDDEVVVGEYEAPLTNGMALTVV